MGHGTSNIENWTLDIRHQILGIRHWTWDFRHGTSDIGYWTSDIRHLTVGQEIGPKILDKKSDKQNQTRNLKQKSDKKWENRSGNKSYQKSDKKLVVMTTNVLFTVNPMFYFLMRAKMRLLFPKCASAIFAYKSSNIIMWNIGNSMVTAWLLCTDKSASICSWSQV